MKESVFLDTSAIYALINKKDPSHKKVEDFLRNFKGRLFVTNYVFDESVTLIRARLGHEKAVSVGNILLRSPQVEKLWVTPEDEKNAWMLFVSRNDKSYSFTDCTSFVAMRRIKIKKCLSLDGHFRQEGFEEIL
ncbi:MAG: PIN domain-containing protein [Nitrospirae bacterium]|nr:PIN domain-containing protein [Nitrospirota bacterium]